MDTSQPEYFHWAGARFAVSDLLADIEGGKLPARSLRLDEAFVEQYGSTVLALDRARREEDQWGSLYVRIRSRHALQLPGEVLDKPVVLLHVGRNRGFLSFGDGPNYVLGDGNHRMARAFLDGLGGRDAWLLTEEQSERYRC